MRLVLACMFLCAAIGAAAAQTPTDTAPPPALGDVFACASLTDSAARLSCYDQAVGRLRQAQSSGELVALDRNGVDTIRRDAFGFQMPSLPRVFGHFGAGAPHSEFNELALVIDHINRTGDGRAVFYMTNGQVWRQIDDESARRAQPNGGVTVHRATFGSFLMTVDAGGPAIRVHRDQ